MPGLAAITPWPPRRGGGDVSQLSGPSPPYVQHPSTMRAGQRLREEHVEYGRSRGDGIVFTLALERTQRRRRTTCRPGLPGRHGPQGGLAAHPASNVRPPRSHEVAITLTSRRGDKLDSLTAARDIGISGSLARRRRGNGIPAPGARG